GDTSVRGPRVRRQDRRDRRQGEGRGKADGQRDGAPAEHGSDPSPEGPGDKGRLRAVRTDDARRCPARSISADPDPYREILPPAIASPGARRSPRAESMTSTATPSRTVSPRTP